MKQESIKLDKRTKTELLEQFNKISRSYVPEWKFDTNNPDIATALAMIFAGQMSESLSQFNSILDRYHTEFVNLLDVSLHKATPAGSILLLKLVADTAPDVYVDKRTRFLADHGEGFYCYESDFPVYLTSSKLTSAFMTLGKQGRVIPLLGDFKNEDYAGNPIKGRDVLVDEEGEQKLSPFDLFVDNGKGIEKQAMVLYHSRMFDVSEEELTCRIESESSLTDDIKAGKYRFLYYTEEGFIPVESVKVEGKKIALVKDKTGERVEYKGKQYGILVLEANKPQNKTTGIRKISFSSKGRTKLPEYVGNGNTDFDVSNFNVFGDTLANYSECYIGMDTYFSKQGSKITIDFNIGFGEHAIGFNLNGAPEEDLKIVKRRTSNHGKQTVVYSSADDISIEYFNGIGWKRLMCDQEYRAIFKDENNGTATLSFICPDDWEETTVGAYQGRSLKITLQRAENCYMQPCVHRYPTINNMKVRYSYEERYELPERCRVLYGTVSEDVTDKLMKEQEFIGFTKSNYEDNALYLGFNKPFENGPVSLWWQLRDTHREQNRKLKFFYSSTSGFKELRVVDHTMGLGKTGTIMFLPPDDMITTTIEGKRLCWLKITDESKGNNVLPVGIKSIETNAVEVHNIETHEEMSFFLDEVRANVSFTLNAENILDADIWVNEVGELTPEQMNEMMTLNPDRVKVTYNYIEEIEEFFVKWEERDNFNNSTGQARHYMIDRINGKLIFGDGVKSGIPRNTNGIAVNAVVRSCNGAKGNVAAGMIDIPVQNLLYVGSVTNPEAAYGGNDMESIPRALQRGANLISSGGRFVTLSDYEADIINYSDNIDKAKIVVGTDRAGQPDYECLHILVLMKDFLNGSAAFYRLQNELRDHLLEHCEMTVKREQLLVEEPTFVKLNVEVWAEIDSIDDSFAIRNYISQALTDYLTPIADDRTRGWAIGEMPCKEQILMKLNALKSKSVIKHIMVTADYSDNSGIYEIDLDEIKVSPYMVVCNGKHEIHLTQGR